MKKHLTLLIAAILVSLATAANADLTTDWNINHSTPGTGGTVKTCVATAKTISPAARGDSVPNNKDHNQIDSVQFNSTVPEPATIGLLLSGLALFSIGRRK